MQINLLFKKLFIFNFVLFVFTSVKAQTPGLIYEPATGVGSLVLDPNQDGYTSLTTDGFTSNDQISSEIPFLPMVFVTTEPTSDLGPGPDCRFTDFVQQTSGIQDAGQYYLSPANNWLSRFRMGGTAPNSKSYSVLIDTDQKFGRTGANADPNYVAGNPGFEIELVLATGFGVYVYDVNGTTTSVLKRSFLGHDNYQKSIAVSTQCSDPDYFYDFYVPFDTIIANFPGMSASTPLRMVLIDNMAAQKSSIAQQPSVSDLGGVDDAAYGYNLESIFNTIISNYTPTSANNTTPTLSRTDTCPVINSPILNNATTVSGTTVYGIGIKIKIYKNRVLIDSTTSTGGGAWTRSISPALTTNDTIGASATTANQTESVFNCNLVIVSASICSPALTYVYDCGKGVGNDKASNLVGGAISGAVIKIYLGTNSTAEIPLSGNVFTAGSPNTINVASDSSWVFKCIDNQSGQTTNCNSGSSSGCLVNNGLRITQTVSGQCESKPFFLCDGGTTTTVPTITTNPLLTDTTTIRGTCASIGSPGNTIYLYADSVQIGTTTVISGTTWSISGLSLTIGQVITARAKPAATGGCFTAASTSKTVTRYSITPVIASTACSLTPINSVSGTSSEASGTKIRLFKNASATPFDSTTVDAFGNWSKTGITTASGDTIRATAIITGGVESVKSAYIIVTTKTSNSVIITPATIQEKTTSVSGTGTNGDVIKLYVDGQQIECCSTTVSGGAWTISGIDTTQLYASGYLQATATSSSKCESALNDSTLITCIPPTNITLSTTASTCQGSIVTTVTLPSSQSGVIYQLYNGGSASGPSKLGTGSALVLSSGVITAATTLTCKATKLGYGSCTTDLSVSVTVSIDPPDSSWYGRVSTDWFDPRNWCLSGNIPTSLTSIKILSGMPRYPIIDTAGAVTKSIRIDAGATVNDSIFNLDVYGNWINNGGGLTGNSTGTVTFKGDTIQTIGGTSATTFQNLRINNSGITDSLDKIVLSSPLSVTGALTMTDGKIYTDNTNILTVTSTGSTSGASDTSFVDGPMLKAGTTPFIFPVGDSTKYGPIGIGTPTSSTTFKAEYFKTNHYQIGDFTTSPTPELTAVSAVEYWNLSQAIGTGEATVGLYWRDSSFSKIYSCDSLRVGYFNADSLAWQNNNNPGTVTSGTCPNGSPSISGNIYTSGNVTKYGSFTFGTMQIELNPLPVKLISFKAHCVNQEVVLNWSTASELNNDYFSIERGINSISNLLEITKVKGNGTSSSITNYKAIDKLFDVEKSKDFILYYRLKQFDFNGRFEYSNFVVLENCGMYKSKLFLYPTYSNGKLRLSYNNYKNLSLEVYDIHGSLVNTRIIPYLQTDINLDLLGGIYFYQLKSEGMPVGQGKLIME